MRRFPMATVVRDIPEDALKAGDRVVILDDHGDGVFTVEAADSEHPDPVTALRREDFEIDEA